MRGSVLSQIRTLHTPSPARIIQRPVFFCLNSRVHSVTASASLYISKTAMGCSLFQLSVCCDSTTRTVHSFCRLELNPVADIHSMFKKIRTTRTDPRQLEAESDGSRSLPPTWLRSYSSTSLVIALADDSQGRLVKYTPPLILTTATLRQTRTVEL